MNDIVAAPRRALALPDPGMALQRTMDEYRRMEATGEAFRFAGQEVPQFVKDEAAARLSAIEARSAPATLGDVLRWLAPLAGSVAQAPSEGDFQTRAGAILAACQDVPGWAFCEATSLAAVRKFQWFPAAAEVRTLLLEELAEERRERRALRAIASRRGGAAEPPRETQRVRDEMASKLRGVVEEASARAVVAEASHKAPVRINARPLNSEHLARLRAESPLVQKAREMQAQIEAEKGRG